MDITIYWP